MLFAIVRPMPQSRQFTTRHLRFITLQTVNDFDSMYSKTIHLFDVYSVYLASWKISHYRR